jgi:hypothetical protein
MGEITIRQAHLVDHRTFLGAVNCGYRSAGSNEGKDRWANLDNGQRSALVCGPRKFDKTGRREPVAVIHANGRLSSGHISLSSVAPDISGPPLLDEAAEAKFRHGHLLSFSSCKIEFRDLVRAGTCNHSYGRYESAWDGQALFLIFCATSQSDYRQSLYKDSSRNPTLH